MENDEIINYFYFIEMFKKVFEVFSVFLNLDF